MVLLNFCRVSFQVCVVEYNTTATRPTQRKLITNVLLCDENDKVGGRHVDFLIADRIASKAAEQWKLDGE